MSKIESAALEGGGYKKGIDDSALELIMRNLQSDQYKYPIKSFIRETVSNCIDAINEKNNAISILSGSIKASDIYEESTGEPLYRDSEFDPAYYNTSHLGLSCYDKVEINYINRAWSTRDLIVISDTGVGIGGRRLEKYFDLGFSTKRLNTNALGCFGLGAKSALAPGAESYRVTTIYNGKKLVFDVYNDKYDSVIPKFQDGKINKSISLHGTEAYYIDTVEMNGTSISVEIKNPIKNKKEYINAVKDQLTYFSGVYLKEYYQEEEFDSLADGEEISFKSKILYEDDLVIIPEESAYTRPHMVLRNVNYGIIDMAELELNDIKTCIGIKGNPNKLEVTPNRESLIYSSKTGAEVQGYIKKVGELAEKMVLEATSAYSADFVQAVAMARRGIGRSSGTGNRSAISNEHEIILRLAKFAGMIDLGKFAFGNKSFKKSEFIAGSGSINVYEFDAQGNLIVKDAVTRMTFNELDVGHLGTSNTALIFTHDTERLNKTRVMYLRSIGYVNVFELRTGHSTTDCTRVILLGLETLSNVFKYRDVVVPEDFKLRQKLVEEKEEKEAKVRNMTAAERRKEMGTVLVHTLFRSEDHFSTTNSKDMYITDVADSECIIGTLEQFSAILPSIIPDEYLYIEELDGIKLFCMAQPLVVKSLSVPNSKCISILDVVRGTTNKNELKMTDLIKKRVIVNFANSLLNNWKFLHLLETIDKPAYDAFMMCKNFGAFTDDVGTSDSINGYFNKVASLQLDILANGDKEAKLKEALGMDFDVFDVVDMDIYVLLEALGTSLESVGTLLNMTYFDGKQEYTPEEGYAVKEYLEKMDYVPFNDQILITNKKYKHD